MIEQDRELWRAWGLAVLDPAVDGAIGALYERLDGAVRRRGPVCWVSGRCCHFDRFGHRLYVTGLEIVWVLGRVEGLKSTVDGRDGGPERVAGALPVFGNRLVKRPDAHGPCPYQVEGLCSIHSIRPLGCRVFFCQSGTEQWQRDLYEQHLPELRRLHDLHGLPYRYMEWRSGLGDAIDAGVV